MEQEERIKLQVLIASFGEEGLQRVAKMKLPELPEVEYLVSCQIPKQPEPPLPPSLKRDDIKISFSDSRGLSRNRNILLKKATAPLCLIADDDLSYEASALLEVIHTFEKHSEISIATFMYCNQDGETEKPYPDDSFDLRHPAKGYFLTSVEIAFRRKNIEKENILFNENFGVGASHYGCGEEDIWMHQLLKSGLSARFFPIMLTVHSGASTGLREASKPEVLRAQGVVIAITYPLTSLPRVVLKAWRISKRTEASFLKCFRYLIKGWADSFVKRKELFGHSRYS